MSKPRAGHTDMVSVKLKKANVKLDKLTQENHDLRMSILNIRHMYEGAIGERDMMGGRVAAIESMLVAVVTNTDAKKVIISKATFENLDKYAGVDSVSVDDTLILTALTVEEVEQLQSEIDEMQDEIVEAEIVGEEE